jgi:hypothetical protein
MGAPHPPPLSTRDGGGPISVRALSVLFGPSSGYARRHLMPTRKARTQPSDQELIENALIKARTVLRERSSAGSAYLGPPRLRSRVLQALQREGFELAGKKARVPLEFQLLELISTGAHTPLSDLAKRLGGSTAAEAKKLAAQLSARGDAQLVLREKVLTLIPPTEPTLARDELKRLTRDMSERLKWLKKALTSKPAVGVLKADLQESFDEWNALASSTTEPPGGKMAWVLLRDVLVALADENTGLASIPEVARQLLSQSPEVDLKAELLKAYKEGAVELRPEGGIGRLSQEDAALCPTGAGAIPLSWARLIEKTP